MNNAHLLASTNASASSVQASSTGCKNCQGSAVENDNSSFATLLETETGEAVQSDNQQQLENDPAAAIVDLPAPPLGTIPAAALLAQAANDSLISGKLTIADGQHPGLPKTDGTPQELIAQPGSPANNNQPLLPPLAGFAENLGAMMGQIDPASMNDANGKPASLNGAGQQSALGTTPPAASLMQDNQLQINATLPGSTHQKTGDQSPAAKLPTGQALGNEINSATTNDANGIAGALFANADGTALTDQLPGKALSSLVNNPSAQNVKAEQNAAHNGGAKGNGDELPVIKNGTGAQASADENAAFNNLNTKPDTRAPNTRIAGDAASQGIDRNPQTQSTLSDPTAVTAKDGEASPAPLMQKLKSLTQAAFSLQGADGAQINAKIADALTPAMSITAAGDLARPTGISGLTPTINNPALPQVPVNNIAVHIASQASAGNQRFNIRLDPPELGRIDIRLEIGRDGQTLTHLAVEKPETLDLLRQDQRQLERALTNAGLDSRNGSLSFSLKEENQNRQQAGTPEQDGVPGSVENADESDDQDDTTISRTVNMSSGLDISI